MVLTVTEDTPADMLAGSMELLVQLPRDHHVHTQRVTVPRSTPMMDLLVQIATAHKLSASSYTLQAIGERGLVLPHQPNTPIGALDALQVKLLPKQGTFVPKKARQANQPFETTFRLQVLLPRNQLYVTRVSPKMNLGKILEEVCREKNLDRNKYELRHPANLEETLDLTLSLQDYHLQEVTLYAKQGKSLGAALSSQDIMALQRQEERRRQQAKQSVFGFMFRKSKESSLSIDSLGGRSVSPARSDETGRSVSPLAPPARPQRKRRPAPKPPVQTSVSMGDENVDETKEKLVISHSRNSSDSSGYHEASVLSDNPESGARMPETLPRRSKAPCKLETARKLAQTSQASKSLGNLAMASGGLSHGISSTSISSTGIRKKRAAPPPPIARPLSSAISSQALERIIDSEESLTSDIDISKSPSDIGASSKANSDIGVSSKANSDIGVHSLNSKQSSEIGYKIDSEFRAALAGHDEKTCEIDRHSAPAPPPSRSKLSIDIASESQVDRVITIEDPPGQCQKDNQNVETARVVAKRETGSIAPTPKPRSVIGSAALKTEPQPPVAPQRNIPKPSVSAPATPTPIDTEDIKTKNVTTFVDQENSSSRVLKHVKSLDDIHSVAMEFADEEIADLNDTNNSSPLSLACAVISTIPKCTHLAPGPDEKIIEAKKMPEEEQQLSPKRQKVFRSQSAINNLDTNPFEKHPRHFTSHAEDFTCALNPNFSQSLANSQTIDISDAEKESVEETVETNLKDYPTFVKIATNLGDQGTQENLVTASTEDNWAPQVIEQSATADHPTETDILLQKVSDTLSSSVAEPPPLPPLPPPIPNKIMMEISSDESDGTTVSSNPLKTLSDIQASLSDKTTSAIIDESTANATLSSQQDTSDYVSATGDDLSITDWEYQLPAPPSAFRDDISPEVDGYDTITLRSVEAFKEPIAEEIPVDSPVLQDSSAPSIVSQEETPPQKMIEEQITKTVVANSQEKAKLTPQISVESRTSHADSLELKNEIINELATKIENGTLTQSIAKASDQDSRRISAENAAPKIAPVDNTLSNFTITTYSRQKSLNIFEEETNATDDNRNVVRSFATLSRTKDSPVNGKSVEKPEETNVPRGQSVEHLITSEGECKKADIRNEKNSLGISERDLLLRRPSLSNGHEKSSVVHRSKSYITLANNSKYRETGGEKWKDMNSRSDGEARIVKATSVTNLNQEAPRNNEKFSQWRENILKKQEEPTKEKQLQSLQVLKSILPQLKSPQQPEESVLDSPTINKIHIDTGSKTLPYTKPSESKPPIPEPVPKEQNSTSDTPPKRYKYTGPPAISLGSWTERPRVNVQLKMDTDYKFATNNTSGSKTLVNLNDANLSKPEEPQNKSATPKFATIVPKTNGTSAPKKSTENKIKLPETKPIVTSVALKKTPVDRQNGENNDDDDVKIDTKPVNFAELTKTFGEEVCLRSKSKRMLQNRHSDYYGTTTFATQTSQNGPSYLANANNSTGPVDFTKNPRFNNAGTTPIKRYTSVVGIQSHYGNDNGDTSTRSQSSMKLNGLMPVVKGFKIQVNKPMSESVVDSSRAMPVVDVAKKSGSAVPPPPPTMPVITGVTLKNSTARPKSLPLSNKDPRDQLLESIRNFGGREKLRNLS